MNQHKVTGAFYYGVSCYPIHDLQAAELREAMRPHLDALVAVITPLMSTWSGDFTLTVDSMTFHVDGNGWEVEVTA